MQVTSLEFKNGCFNIYIDGRLFCRLNDETVVKLKLKTGLEISDDMAQEMTELAAKQSAMRDGARLLAAAAKTKSDFIKKLIQKGHQRTVAQETADFFEEKGFINDRKFAESYVRDALTLKKDGIKKIMFSLKKYGIDDEIIKEVLSCEDDLEGLKILAEKELKKGNDINKIKRKLYSKGYSIWDINSVIDELGGSDFEV